MSIGCLTAIRHYWTNEITNSLDVHNIYALNSTSNYNFRAVMHQAVIECL
jgi:hypothetical protein